MKLGQTDKSKEVVLEEERVLTNYGDLTEITIEKIDQIFKILYEDRYYLKPYQEMEDLSKIKIAIRQGNNITEEQKAKYYEICNKHKRLLKLD